MRTLYSGFDPQVPDALHRAVESVSDTQPDVLVLTGDNVRTIDDYTAFAAVMDRLAGWQFVFSGISPRCIFVASRWPVEVSPRGVDNRADWGPQSIRISGPNPGTVRVSWESGLPTVEVEAQQMVGHA